MSAWFYGQSSTEPTVTGWLSVNSWRQVVRRRLSVGVVAVLAGLVMAGYAGALFAITRDSMAALKGTDWGETGGIWFALCVYGSVVPVVTALLALSFRPLFAEPSEAVAAVPMSVKQWYGAQIWRFVAGATALLVTTWTAVTWAMAGSLGVHFATGVVLEVVALTASGVSVAGLAVVVTPALLEDNPWKARITQFGLVAVAAALALFARFQQESGLRQLAKFVAGHRFISGLVVLAVGLLVGTAAVVVVAGLLDQKAGTPLVMPVEVQFRSWRQRWLPLPRPLVLQLAVVTLRGLVAKRKDMAMLVSSLALLGGFGVAARAAHAPSLNSLVLGTAAVYVPLFLSLIMIFGRSTLGGPGMMYTRPVGSWQVTAGQLLAVAGLSAVVTAGFLAGLEGIVGNRIDWGELLQLAGNAAVTSGIAWLCGSLVRVHPRDNITILAAVVVMVVAQGGFYAILSKLGTNETLAETGKLLVLVAILAAGTLAELRPGWRWSRA